MLEREKFEITEVGIVEDDEKLREGEPISRRMARLCQPIMNSVNKDLVFTTEVAEDFPDNNLPTLDFRIEEIASEMIHSYFEKEMKTIIKLWRGVLWESSRDMLSCPMNLSGDSLTCMRRSVMQRRLIVDKFTQQQCRQAIVSGLVGFKRKMARKQKTGESVYRSATSTMRTRVRKKLTKKTSWYKDRRRSQDGDDDED
jgi:hypothetical protein